MAPSTTQGAVSPSHLSAAMKVWVPQRPNGAEARKRCPRRLRPRSRVILVLTAVSSMNTRRAGWSRIRGGRLSIHSRRRSRTSARSRSEAISCFFICEPGLAEHTRERGRACDHVALYLKRAGQFGPGHVRLGLDARDQKSLVGRQLPAPARAPPLGRLNRPCSVRPLEKLDGATRADPKMPGRVTARMPGLHVPHDARPQIQGITLAHDRSPDHEELSIAAPVTPLPIPSSSATL